MKEGCSRPLCFAEASARVFGRPACVALAALGLHEHPADLQRLQRPSHLRAWRALQGGAQSRCRSSRVPRPEGRVFPLPGGRLAAVPREPHTRQHPLHRPNPPAAGHGAHPRALREQGWIAAANIKDSSSSASQRLNMYRGI